MQRYIIRRLLVAGPVLFIASLVVFTLLRVMPGDPARMYLQEEHGGNEETYRALREHMGLDRPLIVQYGLWVRDLFTSGGERKAGGASFGEELRARWPVTMELAGLSVFFALLVGIPGGVLAAVRQDTPADYAFRVTSIVIYAIPHFWLGVMLILVPLHLFGWTPNTQYVGFFKDPGANFQQFVFPALIIGITSGALLLRMTRSALLEVMRSDYIRTAHSKGLKERVVLLRHSLRNALIPVITVFGAQLGHVLTGSIIMEQIFQLPGLGRLIISSLNFREYDLVQSLVLLYVMIFVGINLLIDLSYSFIDPRIRLG